MHGTSGTHGTKVRLPEVNLELLKSSSSEGEQAPPSGRRFDR